MIPKVSKLTRSATDFSFHLSSPPNGATAETKFVCQQLADQYRTFISDREKKITEVRAIKSDLDGERR